MCVQYSPATTNSRAASSSWRPRSTKSVLNKIKLLRSSWQPGTDRPNTTRHEHRPVDVAHYRGIKLTTALPPGKVTAGAIFSRDRKRTQRTDIGAARQDFALTHLRPRVQCVTCESRCGMFATVDNRHHQHIREPRRTIESVQY